MNGFSGINLDQSTHLGIHLDVNVKHNLLTGRDPSESSPISITTHATCEKASSSGSSRTLRMETIKDATPNVNQAQQAQQVQEQEKNHTQENVPPVGSKKLINLLRGWPSPHLLPSDLLKSGAERVLSNPSIFVPALQYGPDPGYQPLRESLAVWLARAYHPHFPPISVPLSSPNQLDSDEIARLANEICITGGASQSIANILASFTDPGYTQSVWCVAPCYFLACPIFEDAGFRNRLRAVPEDVEGVDIEWLERGLKESGNIGDEKPVGLLSVFVFLLLYWRIRHVAFLAIEVVLVGFEFAMVLVGLISEESRGCTAHQDAFGHDCVRVYTRSPCL